MPERANFVLARYPLENALSLLSPNLPLRPARSKGRGREGKARKFGGEIFVVPTESDSQYVQQAKGKFALANQNGSRFHFALCLTRATKRPLTGLLERGVQREGKNGDRTKAIKLNGEKRSFSTLITWVDKRKGRGIF